MMTAMRTTLDLDEDILQAAKELAARTLRPEGPELGVRNGVPLLPARADERPVTAAAVNRLRDDE
jgi:hypothetical protein